MSATQPAILDEAALKGLKRLQERAAKADVDLWQLLWLGDTANWEQMITQSFAAGMSLELEESTVQQQVRCFDFKETASSPACVLAVQYAWCLIQMQPL